MFQALLAPKVLVFGNFRQQFNIPGEELLGAVGLHVSVAFLE